MLDGKLIPVEEMNDRLREAYKIHNKIPPDKLTLTTQQALVNYNFIPGGGASEANLPNSEIISTTKNQRLRFNSLYIFDFMAELLDIIS